MLSFYDFFYIKELSFYDFYVFHDPHSMTY